MWACSAWRKVSPASANYGADHRVKVQSGSAIESMMPPRQPSRRDFLRHCSAGAAALLTPANAAEPEKRAAATSDLIRRENEKPGTRDWMLTNTRVDPATKWRCPWIEGYCSHASISGGETLRICVSTNPASEFRLEISGWDSMAASVGER